MLIVLLFLCAALGLAVYLRLPIGGEDAPTEHAPQAEQAPVAAGLTAQAGVSVVHTAATPRQQERIPLPETPHALPGEAVVALRDAGQIEAFVNAARAHGLRVLGVSHGLAMVRVAGSPDQLAGLAGILPEGSSLDNNYAVLIPRPPEVSYNGLAAFGVSALQAMGVPDNKNWGAGVKMAILDTGVMPHSSLAQARISQIDLLGTPGYGSHGTATASLVVGNEGEIQGVAPKIDLLSVRVLDGKGEGNSFTVAQGILTAVNWGADVIAIPLGTYGDSRALRDAVEAAVASGAVVVAAAGNDGTGQPMYPASDRNVIGVGAIDALGSRAPFTNMGTNVTVGAPGVGLPVAGPQNSVQLMTGTSASTALVGGIIAGIQSSAPGRSSQEATAIMLDNTSDGHTPGPDAYLGAGIIDVERALWAGQPGVSDVSINDFYLQGSGSGDSFVLNVLVQNRGTTSQAANSIYISVGGSTFRLVVGPLAPGSVDTAQVTVPTSALQSADGLDISARIEPGASDVAPDNNERSRVLRLSPPPE